MRRLVHLSDLHFGNANLEVVGPLIEAVRKLSPDVVAVSGDLVQHASAAEFAQASNFLDALPGAHIVVPGNHDLSFYNPWRRATEGLRLYHRYITADREPFYADPEVVVMGLPTARVLLLRDGRIGGGQVRRLEERMRQAPDDALRVLVTHHPFDLPESFTPNHLVGRAGHVMERVVRSVDLLLAGHFHVSSSGQTTARYRIGNESAVFVQGGTALSRTQRGEPNSFHALTLSPGNILVDLWVWQSEEKAFRPQTSAWFRRREPKGWISESGAGDST